MTSSSPRPASRLDYSLAGVALIVIALLLILAPPDLLDKADRAGYAVCHQIPEHSYFIAGRQLPLCARCTGTYIGALASLIVLSLMGKGGAGRFPARPYLVVLGVFMFAWGVDGLNSFLALMGLPHLYQPSNLLRLVTGALEGIVIAAVLAPAFNMTVWRLPNPIRSIASRANLLWLLLGAGIVVAVVNSEQEWLLYPVAVASGLMVPALLGSLNTMFYLAFRGHEGAAARWRDVAPALLIGLAMALCEIALIGLGRDALTARLGLPF